MIFIYRSIKMIIEFKTASVNVLMDRQSKTEKNTKLEPSVFATLL